MNCARALVFVSVVLGACGSVVLDPDAGSESDAAVNTDAATQIDAPQADAAAQADAAPPADANPPDAFVPMCGDGITTAPETCDTAGESTTCDSDCTAVSCGDGLRNATAGEACDTAGDSASCDFDCSLVACGDGHINTTAGEVCDGALGCRSDCRSFVALVGSYDVGSGQPYDTNPPCYSCRDACALIYGGVANDYRCSTSDATLTGTGYYSGWGDGQYCTNAQPDDFVLNTTYDCGAFFCSYSAYVQDHCSGSINYCWR